MNQLINFFIDANGVPRILRIISIVLSIVLIALLWPFRTVPTGFRGVITQFGAIRGIENEGLVVLPPWQTLNTFNVRAEQADIENAEGATKDTQPVKVSLTVRYSITPDKVAEVFEKYSRNGDLTSYVQTAALESFKAVTAKYTAPELISQRALVSNDITGALRAKLALYGAQVINIDMRNFAFDPAYMTAINTKVTEEQKKLAAENRARTVEAEQRVKIVTAEAEASATRARADGESYAALKVAHAQAESLRITNQALAQNKDVLDLKRIEVEHAKAVKWNGVLPLQNVFGTAPIPYMNMGATK
jgi:prohibitin 2